MAAYLTMFQRRPAYSLLALFDFALAFFSIFRKKVEAAAAATTAEEKAKASLFSKYLAARCVRHDTTPVVRGGGNEQAVEVGRSLEVHTYVRRVIPFFVRGTKP